MGNISRLFLSCGIWQRNGKEQRELPERTHKIALRPQPLERARDGTSWGCGESAGKPALSVSFSSRIRSRLLEQDQLSHIPPQLRH